LFLQHDTAAEDNEDTLSAKGWAQNQRSISKRYRCARGSTGQLALKQRLDLQHELRVLLKASFELRSTLRHGEVDHHTGGI
jgi:sugar-specific transcriptional regulator TrmB